MDNIIKNPTFIAVITGVITYTYIVWKKNQNRKKNKKNKKNTERNEMIIPTIVAIIVWFIVYGYLTYNKQGLNQYNQLNQTLQNVPTYKLVKDISESPKSFTLINPTGGISFPTGNIQMPDIFIDNFN